MLRNRRVKEGTRGIQSKFVPFNIQPATVAVVAGVNRVLTPTVTQNKSKVALCPVSHLGVLHRPFITIRRPFPKSLAFKVTRVRVLNTEHNLTPAVTGTVSKIQLVNTTMTLAAITPLQLNPLVRTFLTSGTKHIFVRKSVKTADAAVVAKLNPVRKKRAKTVSTAQQLKCLLAPVRVNVHKFPGRFLNTADKDPTNSQHLPPVKTQSPAHSKKKEL